MGEQGWSDVPVPGDVAADRVLVEPDLGFLGLQTVLDRPAGTSDPNEILVTGADRGAAQAVRDVEFAGRIAGQRPTGQDSAATRCRLH
ncbi:hypothetical protein ACFXG4_38385 [Nocardia sp. NPDC059246]|uniref:hypothetical protein n=1 Tax=unclassified Nocardia TaxID=2637762 RepID=UPI0036CD50DE